MEEREMNSQRGQRWPFHWRWAGRHWRKEAASRVLRSTPLALEQEGQSDHIGGELPLSILTPGESARIQKLVGGHEMQSRLASLGFTPGATLVMVQNFGHGPVIVNIRGTRIALGRGEASKIYVAREKTNHA